MCRINLAQLGKQRCTLIKKLSLKTTTYIVNWQSKNNKVDFPNMVQLGKQLFLL